MIDHTKEIEETGVTVPSPKQAPRLPDRLAYLYRPILPFLKRYIHIRRVGHREYEPADVLLPNGFTIELVASELNAPVHCCFDDQGYCYVAESGHKIDGVPRILRIDPRSGEQQVVYTLPEEDWNRGGAVTGLLWLNGDLYMSNTDHITRIHPDGTAETILSGLPGLGDHQTNHPVLGPDGKLYFGQGCATNAGVIGPDDYAFEWLPKFPDFCDVPAQDITLAGRNFESHDILHDISETVLTGAYVPYRTETSPGQVIYGSDKASGAILRCDPDGQNLEVVAWGLRNPYGVAFHPDGRLFCTEHGMDERGMRYIVDDPDDFYEIHAGEWYGWPDFASGIRLDDAFWGRDGLNREPLLAQFPNNNPAKPLVSFKTHVAANGFDFCRSEQFGFAGDAFVACFGDLAPITTVTHALGAPMGFKVMRVDMSTGQAFDFAVNRIAGPASKLPHDGFERPSHCQFSPDGDLYVVDFGVIKIAPERGAIRQPLKTGALWRIRRTGGQKGSVPPMPKEVPLYGIQAGVIVLAVAAAVGAVYGLVTGIRALIRGRRKKSSWLRW